MYSDILTNADEYIELLKKSAAQTDDDVQRNKYVGFLAVTSVTFFEEAFKEIIRDFSNRKHPVLGSCVKSNYERLNGRITLKDIRNDHIPKFGEKYKIKLDKILDDSENESLRSGRGSIKTSYGNIITWRHGFVHGGAIPSNATCEEAIRCYYLGKEVMHCVHKAMRR
jgi:hypothetical protein